MAELAKEEMLKPLDNRADYSVWSPYNYGAAQIQLHGQEFDLNPYPYFKKTVMEDESYSLSQ